MSVAYLKYELSDSYVHHWLVAGPQATPVDDLPSGEGADLRLEIARRYHEDGPGFTGRPAERAPVVVGGTELTWRYVQCQDDHLLDLTAVHRAPQYLRSWAYAEVVCPAAQEATLVLATYGPADVWINDRHVHRQEHCCEREPASASFSGALEQGHNRVLVRLEAVAIGACPYAMALRIDGLPASSGALAREQQAIWSGHEVFQPGVDTDATLPDDVRVYLPTVAPLASRQQMLAHIFDQARVAGYVHHKANEVIVHWDRDLDLKCHYTVSIQDDQKRIYVEANGEAEPGETIDVGHPARIWEGAYDVVLRPRGLEWYEQNTRYEKRVPIHVLDNPYSDALYGSFAARRTEALDHAAKRGRGVFAEIAKMALDRWDDVDPDALTATIETIRQHSAGIDQVMGLLSIVYRYQDAAAFPEALGPAIEECLLGQKYGCDAPGQDTASCEAESYSITVHTCEILAGQRYPDQPFAHTGRTGQWHRERAERQTLEWLQERGAMGLADWDAPDSFEQILAALSLLVDLCENEQVQELAAVLMDKVLLTIALNSFKGVFGSTHRRAGTSALKSGQLEATSGITRLLWGMGVWNHHATGVVSLACSDYEMPLIVADIAVNLTNEMWNREHHPGVDKVTYRTSDYMLCSAQDYHPGQQGDQEHIWQATMGPDAVVFVNHPSFVSEADAHHANFWRGNSVLPRVAQWKDALIAIHKLPENDRLGFTHAHFPVDAFDEHVLLDGWAFARKDSAYLALYASQGTELVRRGPGAYRELRSYGQENVWLCLVGRESTDGSLQGFMRKVLKAALKVQGLDVRWSTPRGDKVSFGWERPLSVNGETQPLAGFKHYDNPFCMVDSPATQIEIRTDGYLMKLNFSPSDTEPSP